MKAQLPGLALTLMHRGACLAEHHYRITLDENGPTRAIIERGAIVWEIEGPVR